MESKKAFALNNIETMIECGMIGVLSEFSSFLQMGGYATTVWPAYGFVSILLFAQWFIVIRKLYRLRKTLNRQYAPPS